VSSDTFPVSFTGCGGGAARKIPIRFQWWVRLTFYTRSRLTGCRNILLLWMKILNTVARLLFNSQLDKQMSRCTVVGRCYPNRYFEAVYLIVLCCRYGGPSSLCASLCDHSYRDPGRPSCLIRWLAFANHTSSVGSMSFIGWDCTGVPSDSIASSRSIALYHLDYCSRAFSVAGGDLLIFKLVGHIRSEKVFFDCHISTL